MDDSDEVPPVEAVEDAEEVRPAKKARTNWKELTATAKPNPNEGGGLFEVGMGIFLSGAMHFFMCSSLV